MSFDRYFDFLKEFRRMATNLRRFTPERFLWAFAGFLLLVAIVSVRYCILREKVEWTAPVPLPAQAAPDATR